MMWARSLGRLLALPLMLGLLGCGFRPAYQQADGTQGSSKEFAAIEVGPIFERPGQQLREELQRRLEGSGAAVHKSYLLTSNFALRSDAVAIEFGSTAPSRIRLVGTVNWTLVRIDGNQSVVASGWAKTVDGFNQIDPQYFYSDLQREQVIGRMTAALADQMVLELAAKLNKAPVKD